MNYLKPDWKPFSIHLFPRLLPLSLLVVAYLWLTFPIL